MANPFKKKEKTKNYKKKLATIKKKKAIKKTKTAATNLGKHIHNNLAQRDLTKPLSETPPLYMGRPSYSS
tara:strand:- start:17415 stop:17624 length:210 start_codon:yes stop_codon:yes gene_type:complete